MTFISCPLYIRNILPQDLWLLLFLLYFIIFFLFSLLSLLHGKPLTTDRVELLHFFVFDKKNARQMNHSLCKYFQFQFSSQRFCNYFYHRFIITGSYWIIFSILLMTSFCSVSFFNLVHSILQVPILSHILLHILLSRAVRRLKIALRSANRQFSK